MADQPEAFSRVLIDQALRDSGWDLLDPHRVRFELHGAGGNILSETNGTVRCHTAYNCTNACPRDIQITRAIGELKLVMVTGKLE